MRLIKMLSLASLVAMAATMFVGAASASATNTQLCTVHTGLTCGGTAVHLVLENGTVGQLLGEVYDILCLGYLVEAVALGLGKPQQVHVTKQTFTGCGTGSGHNNCAVTVEQQASGTLLKTGLDQGSVEAISGTTRLQCPNIGLNCLYDLEGSLFGAGSNHLTANAIPTIELSQTKFDCPGEGVLDALLETLTDMYILG